MLAAGLLIAVSIPAQDCVPAPAGLTGWWPGDGGANDIAGTNNGILEGGATANAVGVVGQAFRFDGTNGYVQIPDSPVFHPTNLTVEYWVLFNSLDSAGTSPAGDQYVVFKQNSQRYNFEGFDLRKIRVGGNDIFKFAVSSTNSAGTAETAELHATNLVVTTGVWYHVAGVRGSNYIQIYVNGQLEGQTNVDFPQDYGTNALYFGTSGESYWDHKLNGLLDEVSLYNRALSADEIAAIYAAGAAGKCKGTNGVSITVQPQSQTAVSGTNVVLTVAAAGVAPLSYQWQFNGTALAGATNTSLTLTNVQSTNSGNYQAVVSNPAGSVSSTVAVLTVLVPPAITVQPTNQTVLVGSTVNFDVAASGSAPLSYQWQWNGTNLDGAVSQTLSLTNVQPAQAGGYGVVVNNAGGSATSAVAVLTVLVPPAITVQPTNQTVLVGSTVDFGAAASGSAPLNYQWQWNGTNLDGAVSQTLSLTNVQPAQAGGYGVMVSNAGGSATSAVAVLTVADPPVLLKSRTTAGGAFTFTIAGTTGLAYLVEVTTNLVEWSPLSSVSNETGQADFIDSTSSNSVSRFYRASWVR